jgi:hypothetical protein
MSRASLWSLEPTSVASASPSMSSAAISRGRPLCTTASRSGNSGARPSNRFGSPSSIQRIRVCDLPGVEIYICPSPYSTGAAKRAVFRIPAGKVQHLPRFENVDQSTAAIRITLRPHDSRPASRSRKQRSLKVRIRPVGQLSPSQRRS